MRFLFITSIPTAWGGSEWLWSKAALRLRAEGHEIAFVHPSRAQHPELRRLHEAGLYEFTPPTPRSFWKRWISGPPPDTTDPLVVLKTYRPDLVVFSQAGQHSLPRWEQALLEDPNWRHTILIQAVNDALPYSDNEADCTRRLLYRSAENHFVADNNRRTLEAMLGAVIPRCRVVHNPYRVSYSQEFVWPQGDTLPLRLALVGRLDPEHKGHDLLFSALSSPAWRERSWVLHVYGEGSASRRLRAMSEHLGLSSVVFEGHVEPPSKIWERCHVVAQPSRQEGLPIAMLEGMLCGRPVLATQVAGIPELVTDGVEGFLAEAAAVVPIAAALERLWNARDQLRQMGRAAQEAARAKLPVDPAGDFARRLAELARK